jgi:hypothetical protein
MSLVKSSGGIVSRTLGGKNKSLVNKDASKDTTGMINTVDQEFSGEKTFIDGIISDLTGNVAGDVTGNVSGNVTGDLTGNVTGNVAGNAATVTGGVYTSGNQSVGGVKNFTSHPQVASKYIYSRSSFQSNTANENITITGTAQSLWLRSATSYTPHSSTSIVLVSFRHAYALYNSGDNDMYVNYVIHCVNGSTSQSSVGTIGGGGSDQRVGSLNNSAAGGTNYDILTSVGLGARASDGKIHVRPIMVTPGDGTAGYGGSWNTYYNSVTFLEMY